MFASYLVLFSGYVIMYTLVSLFCHRWQQ